MSQETTDRELLAYEEWMRAKFVDVSRIPVEKRWGDRIHVHDAVHIGWVAWMERADRDDREQMDHEQYLSTLSA